MVSVGASISMISISLDRRKIQKSCFLANVNVDGKHLRQFKKINIQQRLPIVGPVTNTGNSILTINVHVLFKENRKKAILMLCLAQGTLVMVECLVGI